MLITTFITSAIIKINVKCQGTFLTLFDGPNSKDCSDWKMTLIWKSVFIVIVKVVSCNLTDCEVSCWMWQILNFGVWSKPCRSLKSIRLRETVAYLIVIYCRQLLVVLRVHICIPVVHGQHQPIRLFNIHCLVGSSCYEAGISFFYGKLILELHFQSLDCGTFFHCLSITDSQTNLQETKWHKISY